MPYPFRHYENVLTLDLPAGPQPPAVRALDVLAGRAGAVRPSDGPAFLSSLFYYSAAVSASKVVPSTGYRYALRVNPSSGNLHPTEFHFLTRGLREWPDGLYHYRPSSHVAEQRAAGTLEKPSTPNPGITAVLTSIVWREAWKYRERAYRYCLHDAGHAWQALELAARALGCDVRVSFDFDDKELATALRLAEDEWPLVQLEIGGEALPGQAAEAHTPVWFGGSPNSLSQSVLEYPLIGEIHRLTQAPHEGTTALEAQEGDGEFELPPAAASQRGFAEVVRGRRSALDFIGGGASMSREQLSAILHPQLARFSLIQLFLYVHRVDGLAPGLYRCWPARRRLQLLQEGDQRLMAAALSLSQDLAGNACLAVSMAGDLGRATQLHGPRGYRHVHFEAGAVGQHLYLGAEAVGLNATGIGAFYDDAVNQYLQLDTARFSAVYHFAIGYAVPDPRLSG